VTSVYEARDALGKRLRALRRQADMSGRRLAESLSWPPSKVSKLENGRQTPTDDDVRAWTRATNSEGETEALLASLHTLEVQHAEWQRQLRTGLRPHQTEIADLDAKTRLFRAFEPTFVPGLLQTAGYARARFAESITVFKVRNDVDEAVQARIQRQEILYRPDKRFHFVLTEAALRYRLCPPEIMLGQHDRLVSFSALPNVKLGIIGFETAYVVEYRKSGLSPNHIQGCPLDCAYCIRHTYGLWDQRQPHALATDAEAVEALVNHRYFQPHITPVQVLNRATDPFLPNVRPHTFAVLDDLGGRKLTNHVLVITRHQMKPDDIGRLNQLRNLKATLLFTYSGIDGEQFEPYPSHVAAQSLKLMSAPRRRRYRTILYWRPPVPGLNDSDEHLDQACELARHADATVFTGLFYRDQIAAYYKANGLPEPYDETARRKIGPETLERRVLAASPSSAPLFRKTACRGVRARPARLQRPLRHPRALRHLPARPA
jgi:DNA repair photolyase/transcriptional regulator with XRE-family HTH domain